MTWVEDGFRSTPRATLEQVGGGRRVGPCLFHLWFFFYSSFNSILHVSGWFQGKKWSPQRRIELYSYIWWIACGFLKSKPRLLLLGFTECFILKMCCVLALCWFHHEKLSSPECLTHWNKGKHWLLSVDSIRFPGLYSHMQSSPQCSYTLYILWPGSDGQLSRWPIFCQSIRLNEQKHSMNASSAAFNVRRLAYLTSTTVASPINKHSCIWKHKFCISAQTQRTRLNHRPWCSCTAQRGCVLSPTPPAPHPAFFPLMHSK